MTDTAKSAREIIDAEIVKCDGEDTTMLAPAIIAALRAKGFKIIAREPTEAMLSPQVLPSLTDDKRIWRCMWDAAQ